MYSKPGANLETDGRTKGKKGAGHYDTRPQSFVIRDITRILKKTLKYTRIFILDTRFVLCYNSS